MSGQVGKAERTIARLATCAQGVVARRELLDARLTEAEIDHRVAKVMLIVEFRGVYRVGHRAPSVEARYMAAVKACGKDAVLSGRAAAYLLGLIKGSAPKPEVTAPTEHDIKGIKTRQSRVPKQDRTTSRTIPTTTVPRTLVDLAATLPLSALARACHEAGVKYGTTPTQVEAVLQRRPNAKGAANLRGVILGEERVVLSKLEKRFLKLLREHGLPLPQTNRPAGTKRVDCRWPKHNLTVELDSYRFHNSRHAWEQDRKREREAYARGDDFRRYTWGDVFEESEPMLAELRALIPAAASASSTS